jgi:hypothetical protein
MLWAANWAFERCRGGGGGNMPFIYGSGTFVNLLFLIYSYVWRPRAFFEFRTSKYVRYEL